MINTNREHLASGMDKDTFFVGSYNDTTCILSLVYLITSAFQCHRCLVNLINYCWSAFQENTDLSLLSGNKEDDWLRPSLEVAAAHPDPEKRNARWKDGSFLFLE